jgi:hypothetical protein
MVKILKNPQELSFCDNNIQKEYIVSNLDENISNEIIYDTAVEDENNTTDVVSDTIIEKQESNSSITTDNSRENLTLEELDNYKNLNK